MFPNKFKYAFINEGKEISVCEKDISAELKKFDVLVKILACGISMPTECNEMLNEETEVDAVYLSFGKDIAGIVQRVGSEVKTLQVGDRVTGTIPSSYKQSGCAEYITVEEYDLVHVPKCVSFIDAAACIGDSFKAYVALFYCSKIIKDDVVLILNGASPSAVVCIQLAHSIGAKVMTTCSSAADRTYLETLDHCIDEIIDLNDVEDVADTLYNECMKKTDYLGVDVILDLEEQFQNKSYCVNDLSRTEDIISCLTIHGRWVSCNPNLQLDPPDSRKLFERCACVSFLYSQAWLISKMFQGKYQHILQDAVKKLKDGVIRPYKYQTISFKSLPEAIRTLNLENHKIVVTME